MLGNTSDSALNNLRTRVRVLQVMTREGESENMTEIKVSKGAADTGYENGSASGYRACESKC